MQEKMYNLYLVISKLAGNSVRRAICQENGMDDLKAVSIKFGGRNTIVQLVSDIMGYNKSNTVDKFKKTAEKLVTVKSNVVIRHQIDNAKVFVESIVKSKDSRNCQRYLVDYLMAERYFKEAYDYDVLHHVNAKKSSVEKAKAVIRDMYSLNFLSGFFFDGPCPKLDQHLKEQLCSRAFDPLYSCTTEEKTMELMQKKYLKEFSSRKEAYISDATDTERFFRAENMRRRLDATNKPAVRAAEEKAIQNSANPAMNVDLYRSMFIQLPTERRKRRFRNLKHMNSDILTCHKKELNYKQQYANIEYKTKHSFIQDCYTDKLGQAKGIDTNRQYFNFEANMYRKLWDIDKPIVYKQGKLYFPDGAIAAVEKGRPPFETLHKINAIYAALFGFGPDDISNPTDWLFNSIRAAYTDEGVALYRMAMVEARLKGRT